MPFADYNDAVAYISDSSHPALTITNGVSVQPEPIEGIIYVAFPEFFDNRYDVRRWAGMIADRFPNAVWNDLSVERLAALRNLAALGRLGRVDSDGLRMLNVYRTTVDLINPQQLGMYNAALGAPENPAVIRDEGESDCDGMDVNDEDAYETEEEEDPLLLD